MNEWKWFIYFKYMKRKNIYKRIIVGWKNSGASGSQIIYIKQLNTKKRVVYYLLLYNGRLRIISFFLNNHNHICMYIYIYIKVNWMVNCNIGSYIDLTFPVVNWEATLFELSNQINTLINPSNYLIMLLIFIFNIYNWLMPFWACEKELR